jgi:hypothetical protein
MKRDMKRESAERALNLAWLVALLCIAFLGCKHLPPTSAGAKARTLDVVTSLDLGIREASKNYDLTRPYDLDARRKAGDWVFTFYFLPRTPGDELIVVVNTNGVKVGPGL